MNRLTAIALYVVLLFCIGYIAIEYFQLKQDFSQAESNSKALQAETEVYKDKSDQWRSKALAAEGNVKTLQVTHQAHIDSLEAIYQAKIKNIRTSITSNTSFNTELNIKPDSISKLPGLGIDLPKDYSIQFREINKWYHIIGTASPYNVNIKLSVYDRINYSLIYRRKHLLARKQLYIESKSFNPYTRVTNTQAFTQKESDPGRFGLGFSVGVGLSEDLTPSPYIGGGINYTIWRF